MFSCLHLMTSIKNATHMKFYFFLLKELAYSRTQGLQVFACMLWLLARCFVGIVKMGAGVSLFCLLLGFILLLALGTLSLLSGCLVHLFGCCLLEACCFLKTNREIVDLGGKGVGDRAMRNGGRENYGQDLLNEPRIHFQKKKRRRKNKRKRRKP